MAAYHVAPELGTFAACDTLEDALKWASEDAKEPVSLEGVWRSFSGGFQGIQYFHPNGNPYRRGWIFRDIEV